MTDGRLAHLNLELCRTADGPVKPTVHVRKRHGAPSVSHSLYVRMPCKRRNRFSDASFARNISARRAGDVFGTTFQYTPNYRQIGIGQYLDRGATVDFR